MDCLEWLYPFDFDWPVQTNDSRCSKIVLEHGRGKLQQCDPMAAYQSNCNWDDTPSRLVALVWTGRFSELSICTLMGMSQVHQKGHVCQGMVIEPVGVSCCVWHTDVCSGYSGSCELGHGSNLFWHVAQMLNQIRIWEIWRLGPHSYLFVTSLEWSLSCLCSLSGRIIMLGDSYHRWVPSPWGGVVGLQQCLDGCVCQVASR